MDTREGDAVAALLSEFIRALERGAAVVVAVATSKDASAEDASAEHASAEDARKKQTLVAATAAAAALPTALAATLAADLPVDDDARRAIRVAAKVAAAGGEHPEVASESGVAPGLEDSDVSVSTSDATRSLSSAAATLRAACCASVGALLDASLSAGVSVPRVLAESATAACASPLTTERDARATRAAAAAMGLAAALGGSWCLAGVRGAGDAKIGFARGLSGPGGARGRAAGEDEAFSTPLLWGGVEGEKSARAAVRALEATASVGDRRRRRRRAGNTPARARDRGVGTRPRRRLRRRARRGVGGVGVRDEFRRGDEIGVRDEFRSVRVVARGCDWGPRGNRARGAAGGVLSDGARPRALPPRAARSTPGRGIGPARYADGRARRRRFRATMKVKVKATKMKATTPPPPRRLRFARRAWTLPSRTRVRPAGASLLETLLGAGGGSDAVFDPGSGSGPRPRRDRARDRVTSRRGVRATGRVRRRASTLGGERGAETRRRRSLRDDAANERRVRVRVRVRRGAVVRRILRRVASPPRPVDLR